MLKKSIGLWLALCLFFANSALLAADEKEGEAAALKPAYVSLGKPMILNLATDSKRITFLQIEADILVRGEDEKTVVESHIPAIRHLLIVLLSEKKVMDIKTPTLREEIRQQATAQVKAMIEQMAENKDVEEVLFSNVLVQ